MKRNKFGMFVMVGALTGAVVSMFDKSTREQVTRNVNYFRSEMIFYSKNPNILKLKLQEKKEKIQLVLGQISDDATYVKEKVDELKLLTPQVQDLVAETKETFTASKDEYKTLVSENSPQDGGEEKKQM